MEASASLRAADAQGTESTGLNPPDRSRRCQASALSQLLANNAVEKFAVSGNLPLTHRDIASKNS